MKHLGSVTKFAPKVANDSQDLLCVVASSIADMVAAKGGTAPMVSWVDGKCAIPVPNTEE